jgi:ABC-type dipeptide/oligopeptide/nickel transport system permease component
VGRYVVRRLALSVPVLVGITVIVFGLMAVTPGDPISITMGEKADPVVVARVRHELGLDRPLWEQYVHYVWNVARGDFGSSFYYRDRSVASIIADGLPVSAMLGLIATGIAILLAVPLGIVAALRQNSFIDYLGMSFAVAGVSVPIFVVAPLLIWVFALQLNLLPVAGWGSVQQAVIPGVALGVRPAALLARQIRQSVIEVLGQDYVRTARAKGLRELQTIAVHVLRNALIPVVTVLGLVVAGLITGTFIIETISAVPGIGNIAVTSVFRRDFPVLMAISLIYAVAYLVLNLVVDVLYAVIDPRIRY